ncbi:MAG: efflux RND transporter periplasmic adaptor subunit [Burkholderiaceae bacterium]|nr:efflux RND transporter periplasmic adaptor subunit [Burkholderiaceae bacterium]
MMLPARTRRLLLLACLLSAVLPAAPAAEPAVSALVQTAPLQRGELLHTLRAYAVVQVPASQTQTLTFQHAMQVQTVAVHAGQAVRKGQLLATLRSDASSALAYNQAQTAVSFAQSELGRMTTLKAQQLATQAQVDAARKALADAQAQLRSLQQQGAGQALTTVSSPEDGVVLAVSAAPGDLLAIGSPLLQLGRRGSLQALAGVPPEDAQRLQPGQPVRLSAVFDPGQHWQGTIRSVGAAINPKTQRLDVLIALPAQPGLPVAGTSVQADMVLGRWRGWVVPRDAVLQDERGAYLYQDDQGKARRVPVQIALESGLQTGITGALDPKLPLVVAGNYELRDGMALRLAGGSR